MNVAYLFMLCYFLAASLTNIGCSGHVTNTTTEGSVFCKNRQCTLKPGLDKKGATGFASYQNALLSVGWNILNIKSGYGAAASNDDVMFAAGYLEGALSTEQIYQHYLNMYYIILRKVKPDIIDKLKVFLVKQDMWMRHMCKNNTDPFWRQMSYVLAQYDGMITGYSKYAKSNQTLGAFEFQVINGGGDLGDIIRSIDVTSVPDWSSMTNDEIQQYVAMNGRCSSLIKVMPGYENVYFSHSTWFSYSSTLRIYKHYDFHVDDPKTVGGKMSFSSYPGSLESLDDFYQMGNGMIMLQTTNGVFNNTLFKLVKPESLLAWHRIRVANLIASSGKEWGAATASYNSGTYNNQYMVVDLTKIKLGKTIEDGALFVVEQIPGLVEYADQTHILRDGYWASYNVPFYERVYNLSGYPAVVAKHGPDHSYQLAPRAKIFRRDQGTVYDMGTMKHLMRYNDYPDDPYSEGHPCNQICCRGDLETKPFADGCYDTKVSDYSMAVRLQADIISGPTIGDGLPPFSWKQFPNASHVGLPEIYEFKFMLTSPEF